MEHETRVDNLNIRIYKTRSSLGVDSARKVSEKINDLLARQQFVNVVFAAAPSQSEFLASLSQEDVEWQRVNAFHMDEYLGLPLNAKQRFGNFLKERIFDRASFRSVNYLLNKTADADTECERYSRLLTHYPADIVCMGIGENSHIAFNDPHVADFDDPHVVKVVDLDESCRQQQVNDGCFEHIDDVPSYAITLTIPTLYRAKSLFCMVPGANKAHAVYHTLHEEITEKCPSTILRRHSDATLFLDLKSAARLTFNAGDVVDTGHHFDA